MKRSILVFTIGLGAGYVLGTRSGREQYDKLVARARTVWDDPRVSKARSDVEAYARAQAPVIAEKAEAIAKSVPGKVTEGVQVGAESAAAAVGHATVVAKDVAGRTTILAKDAVDKAQKTVRSTATKARAAVQDALPES